MSSNSNDELKPYIFSPEKRVNSALSMLEDRANSKISPILTGMPSHIVEKLVPWMPGDLIGILGYTSNGKTSLMNYITDQHAKYIHSKGPDYNHIVLRFSWENSIEELTAVDLGRVTGVSVGKLFSGNLKREDYDKVTINGAELVKAMPVWLVGNSLQEIKRRKIMTMDEVFDVVDIMQSSGFIIDFILLDYLQRIKRRKLTDLRESFMDIVDDAKTLSFQVPTILASQAKRDVLLRPDQQPELPDSQETSNYEQACTHMYSVWKIIQKYAEGKTFHFRDLYYTVYDKLYSLKALKQTMGSAPLRWLLEVGYGGTYIKDVPQNMISTKPPKDNTDGKI